MADTNSRALAIEVIVRNVLETMDSPTTVAICARLNKVWYQEAMPVLWRGASEPLDEIWRSPGVEHLTRLAKTPERFSFYVRFIKNLTLYGGEGLGMEPIKPMFASSLWRQARPVSITADIGSDLMHEEEIESLLQADLRDLNLFGGYYSDGFLTKLQTKSPRVVNLLIDNRSDDLTSQGLLEFLRSMPQIRRLELIIGFELVITEPVMIHLWGRPNLEHLALGDGPILSRYVLSQADSAIGSLSSLDLNQIDGDAARWLLPRMKSLRTFKLNLENCSLDLSKDIIRPLSYCARIRKVEISMHADTNIVAEDLMAVASGCPELRVLEISANDIFPSANQRLPSECIVAFAKSSPMLETLLIEYPCTLDTAQFCFIGKHLRQLRNLDINATIELLNYDEIAEKSVFSALECLGLETFTFTLPNVPREPKTQVSIIEMENSYAADALDGILRKWMPKLSEFRLSTANPRHRIIEKLITKRLDRFLPP